MAAAHPDSFKARKTMEVGGKSYTYFSLKAVEKEVGDLSRLPFTLRILMENLVRHEDGTTVKKADIAGLRRLVKNGGKSTKEINFRCARVLMQDFTGVPAVVDLAAMRDAMGKAGWRRQEDQSAGAGRSRHRPFGHRRQFRQQLGLRRKRQARVRAQPRALPVPALGPDGIRQFPRRAAGTGICHQVNLEYLSQVVFQHKDGKQRTLYPDTLVGTDSHTTMVNGLAVLGWGVGGIEAEAAMLGQPQPMVIPEVVASSSPAS
jgi:aconitate hydratase